MKEKLEKAGNSVKCINMLLDSHGRGSMIRPVPFSDDETVLRSPKLTSSWEGCAELSQRK